MATTQLHPGALVGERYGSFAGRAPFVPFVVRTQLHAGAITGRRYGSFAGRVPVVPVPPPLPDLPRGGDWKPERKRPSRRRRRRKDEEDLIVILC